MVRKARITQGLKISNSSCLADVLPAWELAEAEEEGIPAFCQVIFVSIVLISSPSSQKLFFLRIPSWLMVARRKEV